MQRAGTGGQGCCRQWTLPTSSVSKKTRPPACIHRIHSPSATPTRHSAVRLKPRPQLPGFSAREAAGQHTKQIRLDARALILRMLPDCAGAHATRTHHACCKPPGNVRDSLARHRGSGKNGSPRRSASEEAPLAFQPPRHAPHWSKPIRSRAAPYEPRAFFEAPAAQGGAAKC